MVETDPEIPLHKLMPDTPVVQILADNEKLSGVIKNLLRSDADYMIMAEAREGLALDVAVRLAAKGGRRMKITYHTSKNEYLIEENELMRHALIIGITGSGKTNTSKALLNKLWIENVNNSRTPFMVIESAKDERVSENEMEILKTEYSFTQENIEETEDDYADCFVDENLKDFFKLKDSTDYEIDNSQEAIELRNMGINFVDIKDVDVNNKKEIITAVDDMFRAHPELRGQLSAIQCREMGSATYAGYGPLRPKERFGGVLVLNSSKFSDPKLKEKLIKEGANGWWMPGVSPASIISHELGHGMHLELCALDCGVKNGIQADRADYKKVIRQYRRGLSFIYTANSTPNTPDSLLALTKHDKDCKIKGNNNT